MFYDGKYIFFRFDIANPTRRFVLRSLTLQTGTVSIVIYFASLILSLSIANIEDRMNLYGRYPELWDDPKVRTSHVMQTYKPSVISIGQCNIQFNPTFGVL